VNLALVLLAYLYILVFSYFLIGVYPFYPGVGGAFSVPFFSFSIISSIRFLAHTPPPAVYSPKTATLPLIK
jgi:hypothetical protein